MESYQHHAHVVERLLPVDSFLGELACRSFEVLVVPQPEPQEVDHLLRRHHVPQTIGGNHAELVAVA